RIRSLYPLYEEKQNRPFGFELPREIADLAQLGLNFGDRKRSVFEFISEDEIWKVGLTREFISVSTKRYITWEEFKQHLQPALDALTVEYAPSFFSRIGLRYRDLIQRSQLNLSKFHWSQLLKPHIAGELSSPDVADHIEHALRQTTVRLDEYD